MFPMIGPGAFQKDGARGSHLEKQPSALSAAGIIMANRRIAMRKIRQVLRLAFEAGASRRRIAKSLGLSRDVVTDYLTRVTAAGLSWPLPPDLDEAQLEDRLFPPMIVNALRKPEPAWAVIHHEMKRKGATLQVPQAVVCDNLKSAVTKASRTEPKVHPAYQHLAEHYDTLILPARPRKPKDKAKAENAVLIVERWILFRLHKRVFTSLLELNEAIRELLNDLNERKFQKLPGSRRTQFEALDQPELTPLPTQAFEYTEFRKVRIGLDGCFEVDGCMYSAPFTLCRQSIELRITSATIEILHRGRRVASHARSGGVVPIIDPQHLQPANRYFGLWSADHELAWAATIGPNTQAFLQILLSTTKFKEQGYRSAGALKRMEKEFGAERLEAGCARAVDIGANSLSSVRSILRTGLDQQKIPDDDFQEATFLHPNVRGSDYYH